MRTTPALLVLAALAVPFVAPAQEAGCTYERCALRLQHRFFSGTRIVEGASASRHIATVGMFVGRIPIFESASDSARRHYTAFRSSQNRGSVLGVIAAIALGASVGVASSPNGAEHKTAIWTLFGVGVVFAIPAGVNMTKAQDELQQAIWHYNRGLGR